MDLSQFDTVKAAEAGAFMQLNNPDTGVGLADENGRPFGITFAGMDSDRSQKYQRAQQNRRLALLPTRRGKITAEQIEDEGLGLLAACAISWHVIVDGTTPECTPENVREFLRRFPAWREQADSFVGERSNFLGNSARS